MKANIVYLLSFTLLLSMAANTALGQTSGKEVVSYFTRASDFSSVDALVACYKSCMSWNQMPLYKCKQGSCDSGCEMQVACVISDNTLMGQLIDYVDNNATTFVDCVITAGHNTIVSTIRVVPIPDVTSAPNNNDEKSFIAKYPYVIAAIAVAVLVGIIIASVLLIQRRANHLAEMDDESMLAENEAPGWNASSARRNDLPPSNRTAGGSGAAGGRGSGENNAGGNVGRGRGGGAANNGAPRRPAPKGTQQRQKSAADADEDPFNGNKSNNRNSQAAINGEEGGYTPVSNTGGGGAGGYEAPTKPNYESADQAAASNESQQNASPSADASPSSNAAETTVVNVEKQALDESQQE